MNATPKLCLAVLVAVLATALSSDVATAASRREIDKKATAALKTLLDSTPAARTLAPNAKAILIFPEIMKGGFMVGGQVGNGVLREKGKSTGYYRSFAASYGFQAGVQEFSYVLMIMDNSSRAYLDKSSGWEIGVGPSIVLVDEGIGRTLSSTTVREGVYAFIFGQKGLMAGMGIQGSKITKINPGP